MALFVVSSSGRKELLILSFIGFLCMFVSIYLVYDHIKDEEASFCDVGSHISCSKVRRSIFSELFNVPIAIFGLLFHIFLILVSLVGIQMSGKQLKCYIAFIFYMNVFGVAFIVYLVCAEIYLSALCPFCTVLHIAQLISMYIIWKVYNSYSSMPSLSEVLWELRIWILFFGCINFIPIVYFNVTIDLSVEDEVVVLNEEFATCLTHSGWRFYGLANCGWCAKQKGLFGRTMKRIIFIDCAENKDVCKEKQVDAYPTWIKFDEDGNETNRWKGFVSLETWDILEDCPDPLKI
mmetsp:Transcript_17535/g.29839  ORF Transcript_17535/g.29839 Transcript_17535/m.29839 type:complete len:292 (-) Transcript_17535:58-933(-)